jgi:hypothetical protein
MRQTYGPILRHTVASQSRSAIPNGIRWASFMAFYLRNRRKLEQDLELRHMSPATFRAIVVTTLAVHIVGAILSAVDSVRYVYKTLPRTGPPV